MYKIEELRVIEEALKISEEAKHNQEINPSEFKHQSVDFSTEERYYRELKSNIQLSMQSIRQTTSCKLY